MCWPNIPARWRISEFALDHLFYRSVKCKVSKARPPGCPTTGRLSPYNPYHITYGMTTFA
jgi:hypothetical protein